MQPEPKANNPQRESALPSATLLGHCWMFHKWSKWTHYKQPMRQLLGGAMHDTFDVRQRRECERCGKIQDIYVA